MDTIVVLCVEPPIVTTPTEWMCNVKAVGTPICYIKCGNTTVVNMSFVLDVHGSLESVAQCARQNETKIYV